MSELEPEIFQISGLTVVVEWVGPIWPPSAGRPIGRRTNSQRAPNSNRRPTDV